MRPKHLTRTQKQLLSALGMNPACWHLLQELPNAYICKHKITGEIKVIKK